MLRGRKESPGVAVMTAFASRDAGAWGGPPSTIRTNRNQDHTRTSCDTPLYELVQDSRQGGS